MNNGFSTVELLVSISIMVLISASVYINYSDFRENFSIKRTTQEIALAVREAQVYGLAVKEASAGSGLFPGYGVYFDINNNKNFILFADKNGNSLYDAGSGCDSSNTECLTNYKITTNDRIGSLCGGGDCSLSNLNILFLRPNPFVTLKTNSGSTYNEASVRVVSLKGKTKTVKILSSGQISVE